MHKASTTIYIPDQNGNREITGETNDHSYRSIVKQY